MKILFLAAYFYPEKCSSNAIYSNLLNELSKNNEVHVITPQPTRGVSQNEYINYKSNETIDGINIHRFPMGQESNETIKRFIRYFKCNHYYKKIAKQIEKYDCVFTASTPPIIGLAATKIAKKANVPFVYNLQDIFPDSLVNAGISNKGSLLWKIGRKIENYTYKNAAKIIVISQSFKKNIMEKGVPENKIEVVYNWIDEKEVVPVKREDNKLFDTFNLDRNKFYVTYAGNLGNSQNIEIILNAAKELRENTNINFVIFGDGSQKQNVISIIKSEKLDNVKLLPMQSYDLVSEVYSLGDASIITCKKGSGNAAFPSKTLSIMATKTAVLTAFDLDSELTDLLNKAHCGICCDSDDADALIKAILKLYNDPALCTKLGQNGREFVYNHLNKQNAIKKYINFIRDSI
ncbi:MAG: glycosyltransferase family 4 protein [Oscillospiraceae bacterium]